MIESEVIQAEDEINLLDLWEKLQEGWRFLAGGTVLGALAAGIAFVVIPPKYESTSTVQIGQVAGQEVEAVTTTLERFKSSMFVLEAANKSGSEKLAERISVGDGQVGDFIKAQIVKGTSLLELKTSSDTPDSSKKLNDILVQQLEQRHEALGAPRKEKIKVELALLRGKLKTVERELAELSEISNIKAPKDIQFSPVSLLVSQRIQKQSELFSLRQQLTNLELMQLPPVTQSTQAIEMSFVSVKPVSPKVSVLLMMGGGGGLVVGILIVFVRDGWSRAKQARARAELA